MRAARQSSLVISASRAVDANGASKVSRAILSSSKQHTDCRHSTVSDVLRCNWTLAAWVGRHRERCCCVVTHKTSSCRGWSGDVRLI